VSVGRFLSQIDIGERLAVSVTYLEPARNFLNGLMVVGIFSVAGELFLQGEHDEGRT
jgi:hypothetical protein